MPKEIELKLSVPANCIQYLHHLPLLDALSISKPTKQRLHTSYYDTPDLALKHQHCALRLRRIGKNWVQTIKTEGRVASGLHERDEWEIAVTTNQPDFTQLSDPKLIKLLTHSNLKQIFITEFTRHTRILRMSDGSQIEFCLDHGKISVDHAKESFAEIELELKSGKPVQLFQLALVLEQMLPFPIRLENISKAERGYILYTGQKNPPVKALPVVLKADMDLVTAFILIAQNCLDQLTRNEHGLLAGSDIEYLHQMRVALRRLRSAFDAFSTVIVNKVPIVHELKWLTRQLNPARNWDVFVTEQISPIHHVFVKHAGIATLIKICETLRKKHNKAARNSIRSKRYTELILKLNLWLDEMLEYSTRSHSLKNTAKKIALSEFTRSLLTNHHQQILAVGKEIEKLDATSLHALRINIKKQRYAIEFFQTLYSPEKVKKYIHSLSELQDILGVINDSTNTQKLLEEIPTSRTKTLISREAIGIIVGWHRLHLEQKKAELKRTLLLFHDTSLFWEVY